MKKILSTGLAALLALTCLTAAPAIGQVSKKTSEETAASALDGTELVRGVQAGGNVKITVDQVKTYVTGSAANAEAIRDTMGTALVAGTNITITPSDGSDTITITAAGGDAGPLAAYALSSTASLTSWQFSKHVQADATSGAIVASLPASGSNEGDWVFIRKTDASTNMVTLEKSDGTDLAWLNTRGDWAMAVWRSSAWVVERYSIAPFRELVTATGTTAKTIPPLTLAVDYVLIGGGGGGGAGRRGAAGSARFGGGGGAHGAYVDGRLPYAAIGGASTISAIVGTGGAGETGVAADDTSGSGGTNGGQSEIRTGSTTLVRTGSAVKGSGGTATTGTGGTAVVNQTYGLPIAGVSSITNGVPSIPNSGVMGAGGAGGGIDTSNTVRAGGGGGAGSVMVNSSTGVGGGGGASCTGGTAGTAITDSWAQFGGGGGGGGGACITGAAGAGADGAAPGGGGGGGGAALNGAASGAGGTGGRGEIRLTWRFN